MAPNGKIHPLPRRDWWLPIEALLGPVTYFGKTSLKQPGVGSLEISGQTKGGSFVPRLLLDPVQRHIDFCSVNLGHRSLASLTI